MEERVAALQLRLAGVLEEQDALRQQREMTEKRLARAARLTDALGEEGLRWRRTAEALQACSMQSTSTATSLCYLCRGKKSCTLVPHKREFLQDICCLPDVREQLLTCGSPHEQNSIVQS